MLGLGTVESVLGIEPPGLALGTADLNQPHLNRNIFLFSLSTQQLYLHSNLKYQELDELDDLLKPIMESETVQDVWRYVILCEFPIFSPQVLPQAVEKVTYCI